MFIAKKTAEQVNKCSPLQEVMELYIDCSSLTQAHKSGITVTYSLNFLLLQNLCGTIIDKL